jgi:hypothetical protein
MDSGPIANIAYTTVRSIFDTVVDGDVICSSPNAVNNTGACPLLLRADTRIACFAAAGRSFSASADLSVSQAEKGKSPQSALFRGQSAGPRVRIYLALPCSLRFEAFSGDNYKKRACSGDAPGKFDS